MAYIWGLILWICWPWGVRNRVDLTEISRNQLSFCQTEPHRPKTYHFWQHRYRADPSGADPISSLLKLKIYFKSSKDPARPQIHKTTPKTMKCICFEKQKLLALWKAAATSPPCPQLPSNNNRCKKTHTHKHIFGKKNPCGQASRQEVLVKELFSSKHSNWLHNKYKHANMHEHTQHNIKQTRKWFSWFSLWQIYYFIMNMVGTIQNTSDMN